MLAARLALAIGIAFAGTLLSAALAHSSALAGRLPGWMFAGLGAAIFVAMWRRS